jgi:polyisoprenoid-binding protein YceI
MLLLLSATGAESAEWSLTRGDIRITCPLTIGGSFEGRSPSVSGSLASAASAPSAFSGEIRVDLRTIDTGISLRNQHMRENYLEVAKAPGFETAVLTDLALLDLEAARTGGKSPFTAQLLVHGVRKSVSGNANFRLRGNIATVDARFPLRISDHGIPPPRYLGVGVADEIQIQASLVFETKGNEK